MEAAGDVYGGVVTGFGEWLPGRGLGHVSEDTTTMISLEQFEEFGRPRTERILPHETAEKTLFSPYRRHALPTRVT